MWPCMHKGTICQKLKNEIIKFYDKLGFKASVPLISERNHLILLYNKAFFQQNTGLQKLLKLLIVSAVGFYNPNFFHKLYLFN